MLTSKNIKTKAKHIIAESSNIIDKVRAGKIYKDTKEDRFSREYFKYYSSWIEQYFPGSDEMNMRCPSPNGKLFTYINLYKDLKKSCNGIITIHFSADYSFASRYYGGLKQRFDSYNRSIINHGECRITLIEEDQIKTYTILFTENFARDVVLCNKKLSEVTTNDIIFVEVQSYYNVYKLEHFLKINETDNILIDDKYLFDDFNFKYFVTSDNPRGPTIVAKRNNWDFVEKYFVEGMESSKDDWNRSEYVLKYKFERLNLDG
jgi:hypothetical protein